MNIGIVTRPSDSIWGGDLQALYAIADGLKNSGHQVKTAQDASGVLHSDFILLSNTCLDQRANHSRVTASGKPYGIITFHEDFLKYSPAASGFIRYIIHMLSGEKDNGIEFTLEKLMENPELIYYYGEPPIRSTIYNYDVLKNARICIASCDSEVAVIHRDCPKATVCPILWPPGIFDSGVLEADDSFLQYAGVEKNNYILQVGRLETRKNQLATVLACKDLEIPLVFIAATGYQEWYETVFMNACITQRKYPVILIHQTRESKQLKNLKIIPMPNSQKLPVSLLSSAYANARVNIHPAFYELPGLTYLESTIHGTPTLASSWTVIKDYFSYKGGDAYVNTLVSYAVPYDLKDIREKALLLLSTPRQEPNSIQNPIFKRTKKELAQEIIAAIENVI